VQQFKEKPVFESKLIRYELSLEKEKREEMVRRRRKYYPKHKKITKELV
jgi:hypothetical protein